MHGRAAQFEVGKICMHVAAMTTPQLRRTTTRSICISELHSISCYFSLSSFDDYDDGDLSIQTRSRDSFSNCHCWTGSGTGTGAGLVLQRILGFLFTGSALGFCCLMSLGLVNLPAPWFLTLTLPILKASAQSPIPDP